MIIIDESKCNGCGLCCKDCVRNALELAGKKARLVGSCMKCGHCIAICPQNAVAIEEYDMSEVKEYSSDCFGLDAEILLNTIKFRRSIRNFDQRPVDKEQVLKIIEAGRYTPTARNTQNVEYIVVQDEIKQFEQISYKQLCKVAERLNRVNRILKKDAMIFDPNDDSFMFKGAPLVILTVSEHEVNAALASANMELMAEAQGLGVLFVGYFTAVANQSKEIREMLKLKKNQKVVTCLALGYPNVKYQRTVPRNAPMVQWR